VTEGPVHVFYLMGRKHGLRPYRKANKEDV